MRVDKGSEFYNIPMKSWLEKNGIEMYWTQNEGKYVIAERIIRILKNKNYKYMNSVSKNVYIDISDNNVNRCNNAYRSTIKMKPVDVKSNPDIDSSKEIIDKNPKFKIGDNVRISKHKSVFAKGYVPNWSEEVLEIKKLKILCCAHMLLMILMKKKLLERFTKKICKK